MYAMDYARARLRAEDEKRSAMLARDPRVYQPDPDEESAPQSCVVCGSEFPPARRLLLCPACRAAHWTGQTCSACGSPITETDKKAGKVCKRCREDARRES